MSKAFILKFVAISVLTIIFVPIFYFILPSIISLGRGDGISITIFFIALIFAPYLVSLVLILIWDMGAEPIVQPGYKEFYLKALTDKIVNKIIVFLVVAGLALFIWYPYGSGDTYLMLRQLAMPFFFFGALLILIFFLPPDPKWEKELQNNAEQRKQFNKIATWDEKFVSVNRIVITLSLLIAGIIKYIFINSLYINLIFIPTLLLIIVSVVLQIYQIFNKIRQGDQSTSVSRRIGGQLENILILIIYLIVLYYMSQLSRQIIPTSI